MKLNHPTALARAHLPQTALLAVVVLCLSACANFADTPQSAVLRDAQSSGLPAAQKETTAVSATWWRDFGDEQLNQLIQEALASNPSLKIVQARLVRAKAGAEITEAASGPQLGVGVDATRQLFTANGMIPKPLAGAIYDTATVQLTGSYELDFFGKNRAALNAALGQARAAQADADAARMLLASNVARSYFQLARLNDQLAVSDRQLAQRTQSLQLVQDRVNAGLDTKIELRQFEATLPELRLQIEALKEQLSLANNALDALVGVPNKARTLDKRALAAIKISQQLPCCPLTCWVAVPILPQRGGAWKRLRKTSAMREVSSTRVSIWSRLPASQASALTNCSIRAVGNGVSALRCACRCLMAAACVPICGAK